MKLNVGDLVELLYDGTTFSGVITAVTPERVELAFTLNIFVEGDGRVTWPNGVETDVDVGANALTKLHLRLPLEQVALAYAGTEPRPAPRHPTRKSRTKDLLQEAAGIAPAPAPQAEPDLSLEDLLPDAPVPEPIAALPGEGPDAPVPEPIAARSLEDLEALLSEISDAEPEPEPVAPEPPPEPRKREGVWVEYEALADGVDLSNGDLFPASLLLVSAAGCVLRSHVPLGLGSRLQLRFALGRDSFDLSCTVAFVEAPAENRPAAGGGQDVPQIYEVEYDTLPSEVRVRMLRAVLGLAKPGLRTQESWTYQLRNKGGG